MDSIDSTKVDSTKVDSAKANSTEHDTGLRGIPVELFYTSVVCPDCNCTFNIPKTEASYIWGYYWACPKCGRICQGVDDIHWTKDKITLAINADKFIEQQVYTAQDWLDNLLKTHGNIGIRLTCGSRTGLKNDLIVAQVFTTRTCEIDTDIWTGVEENLETLLIHIRQHMGEIDKC